MLDDEASPGNDQVGRRFIRVGLQELVERTQRRQPPIDGGDGVALSLAVGDVGVYIAHRDDCGGLVSPGEEEPQVTGVVTVGAGVRAFAPQPAGEFDNFRVHCYLLVVRIVDILPPGGVLKFTLIKPVQTNAGLY